MKKMILKPLQLLLALLALTVMSCSKNEEAAPDEAKRCMLAPLTVTCTQLTR